MNRTGLFAGLACVGLVACQSWDADTAYAQCLVQSGTNTYSNGSFLSAPECDTNGKIKTSGGSGGTSIAEDAAHTPGENIVPLGCRRIDAAATSAGTSGDWATVDCDASGRVRIDTELPDAAALADNTANPTVPGVSAFLMCYDGATWDRCQASLTDTDDGSIARSQVPSLTATLGYVDDGVSWVRNFADPCARGAKTFLPISISTATTTEITPSLAGASTHYYVCSLVLVTNATNIVTLVDDDSDGCGSPTSGLSGGTTTAGWTFAANGGLTFGNGASSVFKTGGTNRVICLVTNAATQLSGTMTVVAAP